MATCSNDPPRSIIREFQKNLSDECISLWPKKVAIRRNIIRIRNAKYGHKNNPKLLSDVEIDDELTLTYKKSKFLYGDSGKDDKSRIIIFTTEQNIRLLGTYRDWYCDGTFDVSPTLFKQVYTIHIIIRGTTLPMVYALLA
ncbi:unnamed protein product, partial [Brachionus calyciflorus]